MASQADQPDNHDRRQFLKSGMLAAGTALGAQAAGARAAAPGGEQRSSDAPVPRRHFGRHKDQVSIIGIGGYHLGQAPSHDEAMRIAHAAIDAGINFFDNAWEYN